MKVRAFSFVVTAGAVLAMAACQPGTGTPVAAAGPTAHPSSKAPAPHASTAKPVVHVTSHTPAPHTSTSTPVIKKTITPAPTKANGVPNGKSQVFVRSIDVAHRLATVQRMKMVSCAGEPTCEDDYKIVTIGGWITLPIAAGATFAAAQDDAGTVCDSHAPAAGCARTITQFAAMAKDYTRKADIVVHNGAATVMNEIFTP